MSKFWSSIVHQLDPYTPGEQPKGTNLVKLNTNENPYGPSPKALAAIETYAGDRLRLYPDPNSTDLKKAIADYYGMGINQVFVGNGSDEVLAHIFQGLFQQSKPLLFPDITYSFYTAFCGLYKIDYELIPLDNDLKINVSDYVRNNGGIIFPNPNAPTGCLLALNEIESLLQANTESVVVVDEAYIDFGGESAVTLVNHYPNLLITQTLSKSRSLAGLRIGLAVGHADLIEALDRVKDSFNSYPLDSLAIVAGVAAFSDDDHFKSTCERVIESRVSMSRALTKMGFKVIPSAANFLLVKHEAHNGIALAQGLRKQGVIIRHFHQDRIAQYLRITIGSEQDNQRLCMVLKSLITEQ
jgi:histidinol-phosphate aminotransferase|tara:strand:+ start:654 stop:1718 length:1065 start_codon:yes stop_codon:yes gene_type:complete